MFGNLSEIRRDALAFLLRVSAEYGDIVHFRLGPFSGFLLNHPDDIERVLVTHQDRFIKGRSLSGARLLFGNGLLTSDGMLHARQRRLIQPAFHRARLDDYARVMTLAGTEWCDRLQEGDIVDIAAEMSRLTLTITTRILFGADGEAIATEIADALDAATTEIDVALLPFAALTDLLPLRHVRRLRAARAKLDRILAEAVERKRRIGGDTSDVVSLLLSARDDSGEGMSHAQLCDEIITLLLASHETTANALAWTWYLLARHAPEDDRMRAELDAVLGGDRLPNAADVPNLPFTRAVLAESMRLYPPAWLIARIAAVDHEAAGHLIPSGSLVVMSPWVVHRNRAYFPDPEQFDPDRWRGQAARPRFSYFPFGGGLRGCMGEGFAWMEGALLLAVIAQRWRFRLTNESLPPAIQPALTLMPKFGIRVKVERGLIRRAPQRTRD